VSEDPHSPTAAGPEPAGAESMAADLPVQPTPTVDAGDASYHQPAGTALFGAEAPDPHPEKLVGAAFAGGLVAALFLKGLARRRHV
jgi:hypothetical protein